MKNRFWLLGMTALLTFVLVLTGCGDSSPSRSPGGGENEEEKNPVVTGYNLIVTASSSQGKQVLNFNMTNPSARAVANGDYEYKLLLGGIIINEGTVKVNGNLYTYTPKGGGSVFTYNNATGASTGDITISQEAKDAIIDAAGMGAAGLTLPDTLTIEEVMEARSGSNGKWDGTWHRMLYDSYAMDPDTGAPGTNTRTGQKITFSGNNYNLTHVNGDTEDGTFIYANGEEGDADSLFIFSRNVTSGFKTAAYLWEGMATVEDPDYPERFLEFYNHFNDSMGLSVDNYDVGIGKEFRKE